MQPQHLQDFVVQLPSSIDHAQTTPSQVSSTIHSLENFVSYDKLCTAHKVFLMVIDSSDDPKYFHELVKDERRKEAMTRRISALKENETWTLKDLPEGKHDIESKWVYKVK